MARIDDSTLDAALARWAAPDVAASALERLEMHADHLAAADRPSPAHAGRWRIGVLAGGAIAASAALALLFARPEPAAAPAQAATGDPAASFALLYTPTSDEEYPL
jgi:hypothetical protein